MSNTIKAREHHGADSLDLTIPAKMVREEDIKPGDVFRVRKKENNEDIEIVYTRVYSEE